MTIPALLSQNLFVVRSRSQSGGEQNDYDILDPADQSLLIACRERKEGWKVRFMRNTNWRSLAPLHIDMRTPQGRKVLDIRRANRSLLYFELDVHDEHAALVGRLRSGSGKFAALDPQGRSVGKFRGNWSNTENEFVQGETALASLLRNESTWEDTLKGSDDPALHTYMLSIRDEVPADSPLRLLILASIVCLDIY